MAKMKGFTIVELLIVIVVIAILAAISVVAYNGIQERSRQAKIESDLTLINKAVMAARVNRGVPLYNITNNGYTAFWCNGLANGTDMTNRSISEVNNCWNAYNAFLAAVSTASGVNINGIVDPWNRPYRVDENENDNNSGQCNRDSLAAYQYPHVQNGTTNYRLVSNSLPNC